MILAEWQPHFRFLSSVRQNDSLLHVLWRRHLSFWSLNPNMFTELRRKIYLYLFAFLIRKLKLLLAVSTNRAQLISQGFMSHFIWIKNLLAYLGQDFVHFSSWKNSVCALCASLSQKVLMLRLEGQDTFWDQEVCTTSLASTMGMLTSNV